MPSAAELVDALRTFLEKDVMSGTEGRLHFMSRVAGNVAAMVHRELVLGPALAEAHAKRLAQLGQDSDAELAQTIRAGELDNRLAETVALIRRDVVDKLSLWNPRYVEPEDAQHIVRLPGEDLNTLKSG